MMKPKLRLKKNTEILPKTRMHNKKENHLRSVMGLVWFNCSAEYNLLSMVQLMDAEKSDD